MPTPPPPDPAALDPLPVRLEPGLLFRVHHPRRAPTECNPALGAASRFAPLRDGERVIPTLYASATIDGALSETVLHDVPVRGRAKRVLVARLRDAAVLSPLVLVDPLVLADLAGPGLRRLGLRRRDLIDTGPAAYPATAAWALAIHDSPVAPAGLAWVARHDDRSRAYLLFGDRLPSEALVALLPEPIPLWEGVGLRYLEDLAQRCGIDVIR